MSKNDTLFLDMEEDYAMAVCKALGLPVADSLDEIIIEAEIELDWRKTKARNVARGIRALKALRVTA